MDAQSLQTLPPLLQPGLRVVFIGYNPGLESARRGHYYAHNGNVFWRQLAESALVPTGTRCEDDASLPTSLGIGFTDLCARPTARADQLASEELIAGAFALRERLLVHQPRMAVFSGRGIFQLFGRHCLALPGSEAARRPYGRQPETVAETALWVIPSSSGLASRWHRLRLELLRDIAAELHATDLNHPACGT